MLEGLPLRAARLAWRKAKRLVEFAAYMVFDTWVLSRRRHVPARPDTVALVCLELLGDYVVWRPFGQACVRELQQRGQHVVLICNKASQGLAARDFPGITCVAVEFRPFLRSPSTRTAMLRKLRSLGVGRTLLPVYPRVGFGFVDSVVRALGAPAWSFDGAFPDRSWLDMLAARRWYARLLPATAHAHQCVHHRQFLQALGLPAPETTTGDARQAGARPYLLVVPGSSVAMKCWPAERFAAAALHVLEQRPGWDCVIAGTAAEAPVAEQVAAAVGPRARSVAGRTSLAQLQDLVAGASLLLGNDSAAVHLAASRGVPAVAVVGGGTPGLCLPYDAEACRHIAVLPRVAVAPMPCFGCWWICRYRVPAGAPAPCIAGIPVEAVTRQLDQALGSG